MKFFFVSGFWSGHPVKVGRDPFGPYTGELGNLCLEGIFFFFFNNIVFLSFIYNCLTFFSLLSFSAVRRPSLSKFHRDRVHRARLYVDRSFHSLVTL